MYRIQIRQTTQPRPWYWRIVARNGQVLATSETYASKRNASRAAEKFVHNAGASFVVESE